MRSLLSLAFLSACIALSTHAADTKDGWIDLMNPDVWKSMSPEWIMTDAVVLDAEKDNAKLKAKPVPHGTIWVNGDKGRLPNLYSKQSFGDCEIHIEYMMAKKSNAGVKFHSKYEIQMYDSFGNNKMEGSTNGGIYHRSELKPKYHHIDEGIPPKVNASKPIGEWQTLDVVWRSPRFNAAGEKIENARVVKAVLNGKVIHENQELKTYTGNYWKDKEDKDGPLMLQADHGPVALRNMKIKPLTDAK